MKCDKCDKSATVHLIEIIDGQKVEKHLCAEHAALEGIVSAPNMPDIPINELVEDFFSQAANQTKTRRRGTDLTCADCGMTYSAFRKRGLLGCPQCYNAFQPILSGLLERAHEGASRHIGKVPAHAESDTSRQERLLQLRQQLTDAIEHEQYEKAASIRDGIRQLEQRKV